MYSKDCCTSRYDTLPFFFSPAPNIPRNVRLRAASSLHSAAHMLFFFAEHVRQTITGLLMYSKLKFWGIALYNPRFDQFKSK